MSQQSASSPTRRIIVTYRRGDAEAHAKRLIQTLRRHFGDDSVKSCYDLSESSLFSPRGGAGESPVVVAVIGRKWHEAAKGPSPGDARAHVTVGVAFLLGIDIITVLVNGAPSSSADFSQHVRLRDARWEKDVEKLVGRLEGLGVSQSKGAAGERASDDLVKTNIRREDAVKLVTALTLYLGTAPEAPRGVKKGRGKSRGKDQTDWSQRGTKRLPLGRLFLKHSLVDLMVKLKTTRLTWRADLSREAKIAGGVKAADVVSCTVFSPPSVTPGATFLVQVFAHLPDDVGEASQLAKEAVKEAEQLGSKTLNSTVAWGTTLRFDLSLPGLAIDEPSQHLIWRGRPEAVQFGVTVAPAHTLGNVIGTVRVSQGGVPFGHVKFQLTVAASEATAPAPQPQPTRDWVRYQKAFISYASKDRTEVLKRVQALVRLIGDFFMDFMTLKPGERWASGLYKHIDESDVFFLFWSTAAKRSKWVMKEVDYALARKGDDEAAPPEIIPLVIEGPPPVKPPRRLSHLHFDDMFLHLMTQPEKPAPKKKGRPRARSQP